MINKPVGDGEGTLNHFSELYLVRYHSQCYKSDSGLFVTGTVVFNFTNIKPIIHNHLEIGIFYMHMLV